MTDKGTDIDLNTAYEDWETRDPREYALREQEVAQHLVELDKFFAAKLKTAGGPGSGNFGHSGRPGEVGGSGGGSGLMDYGSKINPVDRLQDKLFPKPGITVSRPKGYEAFEKQALENLAGTSRTAKGVSDTGTSAEKQKLAVEEGDKLAAKTAENFKGAIKHVWDERGREFQNAAEVHKFTEDLARRVSEGLLPSGQGLYRTWETPNNQTPPKEIKEATRTFTNQLYEKFATQADPIATAAWVEKRMSVIHPWSDGVGRTTKALSAFVLARGGVNLPKYPDTKTYYSEIKKSPESWEKYYRSIMQ